MKEVNIMKKTVCILLAALLVLSMSACGGEKDPGVPSPMKEVETLEKLSEKANCALIRPTGAELSDEAFFIIDGDPQVAEYRFTAHGTECFLRFADADIQTDISGIYVGNGTLFSDTETESLYIENDDLKAQRWVTADGQYIFVAPDKGSWEWSEFDAIVSQFRKMAPKNWNAEEPYAAYQAVEGRYSDESGNVIGVVNIVKDHAGIYVIIDQEDGSRIYWEMDAVLKGGKLLYEKENISQINYDEKAGGTTAESLEDGGAGSVEIQDGTLIFANAYSEQLKGLVLLRSE